MKLNFWQWIGLVLLLIGVAMLIYKKTRSTGTDPATQRTTLGPLHAPAAVPPVV